MKGKMINMIKRHTALFVAICILILSSVAGLIVYAAYTRSDRAKRVIASYGELGARFSSNRLRDFVDLSTAFNRVVFLATNAEDSVTERITICNYPQGDSGKTYERDISYTLNARLVVVDGNTKQPLSSVDSSVLNAISNNLSITIAYKNGTPVTLTKNNSSTSFSSSTMLSGVSTTDVLRVTFSPEVSADENGVALELYTTLANNYPSIRNLSGIFTTEVGAARNSWEGYFNEKTTEKLPSELDGYNYLITGNGVGTITLTWNSNKLRLNMQNPANELPAFTNSNHTKNTTTGIETLTFSVDSDVKSSYRLQFYRGDGITANDLLSWDNFNIENNEFVKILFVPQEN